MRSPLLAALSLLLAGAASASGFDRAYVEASRKDLGGFCAALASFRYCDSTPLRAGEDCDADMGEWSTTDKDNARFQWKKAKSACDDAGRDLDALAGEDAALDKVDKDAADAVSDHLTEILQAYQGHDAQGRQPAPDSFLEKLRGIKSSIGKAKDAKDKAGLAKAKKAKIDAIHQLLATTAPALESLDGDGKSALKAALKAALPPKKK